MSFLELKINLERTAAAIERLATAAERIADFLIPKPVERPTEKPKLGKVRIVQQRDVWLKQNLIQVLRARGYSNEMIAERLEQLKSEELEKDFPQEYEGQERRKES